jgi:hypothetical protein
MIKLVSDVTTCFFLFICQRSKYSFFMHSYLQIIWTYLADSTTAELVSINHLILALFDSFSWGGTWI